MQTQVPQPMNAQPRVDVPRASVLAASGWARLVLALGLSALLWLAVLWALGS
jgi:hypothetical protein